MNYAAAFTDFFKHPKWVTSLLLAGVCCLIPIAGAMVVIGWLISGFWVRTENSYETFPPFAFDNFGAKLERGLIPVVVGLVIGIGGSIVLGIPLVIVSFAAAATKSVAIILLVSFAMRIVTSVIVFTLMRPFTLRASLLQDFGKAFDFNYAKRFLSLMWKELLISSVILAILGIVIGFVVCIGWILGPPLFCFAWGHLDKQIYNLYLARGGEPMGLSPKLAGIV